MNSSLQEAGERRVSITAGRAATALVCVAAILGPLALGGTHVAAVAGLDTVMAVLICLWTLFFRPSLTQLLIPATCLLLPLLQLIPLPDRLLVAIASASAGAWKVVHAGTPNAWGRISIDPAETAAAARRAFLAVGTVMAVAELALRWRWRDCLIAALAASGMVIWILGFAFPVKLHSFVLLGFIDFKGPLMPGRTPLLPPVATAAFGYPEIVRVAGHQYAADSWVVGDGFGPYLITNHFAGAITLTIPFLAAAWLKVSRGHIWPLPRIIVAVGLIGAATATSGCLVQSRAGTASFIMASLMFACFSLQAGWCRRIAVAATGVYLAMIIGFVVILFGPFHDVDKFFPGAMQPRVAALLADGRVVATRVAERMFLASPVLGTGLGTYGDLYPTMTRDGIPWYFAHNEYAQLLAEAGAVGLIALAAAAWGLCKAAATFWRRAVDSDRMLGAAAWAAVFGLAIHSCFDWNLRIPANAFLFCVAAGLALASAQSTADLTRRAQLPRPAARWFGLVVTAAAMVAIGMSFRDAASEVAQRELREAIALARLHAADPKTGSPQEALQLAIARGERMARWDPADAQLAVVLGQAHLHLAMMPQPIDAANACLDSARDWFVHAKMNCAVCRGVAEQLTLNAAD